MTTLRKLLAWPLLAIAVLVPTVLALTSPLLAWRDPVYIVAGAAGVVGLALMLLQPLLAAGYMPGVPMGPGRRSHRYVGIALVGAIVLHVGGLWITSPPDVVDALLFVSATPFSAWGVVAMWALFGAAALAALRKRFRGHLRLWRRSHTGLVMVAVLGTVVHVLLIEGTMETMSKVALSALVIAATAKAIVDLRTWALRSHEP
jgi:hypothetical protein